MPSYALKLYKNVGLASREVASVVIDAVDNEAAIKRVSSTRRFLTNDATLALLVDTDETPIWVGSELTGLRALQAEPTCASLAAISKRAHS